MTDKIKVDAIYEDGVLKPVHKLSLSDKQRVALEVSVQEDSSPEFVDFEGYLAPYWEGEAPSLEEINTLLDDEKQRSVDRLMRQIDGDFSEDE